MEFNYKEHLLLQAIFPELVTTYIVKESYLGIKPLAKILTELLYSQYNKQNGK